jgi:hypothetical protein
MDGITPVVVSEIEAFARRRGHEALELTNALRLIIDALQPEPGTRTTGIALDSRTMNAETDDFRTSYARLGDRNFDAIAPAPDKGAVEDSVAIKVCNEDGVEDPAHRRIGGGESHADTRRSCWPHRAAGNGEQ